MKASGGREEPTQPAAAGPADWLVGVKSGLNLPQAQGFVREAWQVMWQAWARWRSRPAAPVRGSDDRYRPSRRRVGGSSTIR